MTAAGSNREASSALSLLELIRESYKTDEAEEPSPAEETHARVKLSDGYVRQSPVQPYLEGPGYRERRQLTEAILCALMLVLAVAGFFIWKYLFPIRPTLMTVILGVMAAVFVVAGIILFKMIFQRKQKR